MDRVERDALAGTLLVTVCEIIQGNDEQRQRIAIARLEARALLRAMQADGARKHECIVACFDKYNSLTEANDKAACAWMLAAIQERLCEHDLPNWKELLELAKEAEKLLLDLPGTMLQ